MNYTQYLQSGGELAQPLVENRLGKEEVQQLVTNIINGDVESAEILVDNAIKDPENADIAEAIAGAQEAAQQGDAQAQKFISIVGPILQKRQQAQSMKCGGKVRAKIKKACSGKKMEKGGEAPIKKEAKGGKPCPCTLHKVGGRLIEVDCNGIPVAKNGAVMKFETPAGPIDIKRENNNVYSENALKQAGAVMSEKGLNRWYYQSPVDGKIYTAGTPFANNNVDEEFKLATPEQIDIYHNLKGHIKTKSGNWMVAGNDGLYTNTSNSNRYGRVGNSFLSDLGAKDATWNKEKNLWERQGFTYTKSNNGQYSWVENQPEKTPTKTSGQLMFERELAPNTLSDYSLQGRQNWLNSEENRAYLESKGWNSDRRAAYKGSAADNRELLKLIQGRSAWRPEQDELNRINNSRINQETGQINEGWRGMSDLDLMNYKGKMFDLSNEELQRRAQLLSGSRLAIANNTSRNGDEFYVNGQWVDFNDMTGVTGKSLPGQSSVARFLNFSSAVPLTFKPLSYAYRKDGGKMSYADYLK